MKLYSEEQLVNTVEAIQKYLDVYDEKIARILIKSHLESLTPIELPSDEEIETAGQEQILYNTSKRNWWILGAVWLKDKIQGGNDEH